MSRDWQAPFRLLREQFLTASREPHRIKLALAGFSDHVAYSAWYDQVVQSDLTREVTSLMVRDPDPPKRVSAIGTVWGLEEGVRRFDTLAREAGTCLPFDFHPGVRLFPWFNELSNLDPGPVTLWSEFLLVTRHAHFRTSEDWPVRGCRAATLEGNPFLASATAIEQYLLTAGAPDINGYFELMRTVCPWVPNLAGGFPMTPPGVVSPPVIEPDTPEVFRRAVELEVALAAWDRTGGADGAKWATKLLSDRDPSRAVEVAALRLLCAVNPRMAKVADWSRQLDFTDANADTRQALRTLGLAVADIRGESAARGRELLSGGARHLWVGLPADHRAVVQDHASAARRVWGWSKDAVGAPDGYDGPRSTLADPRVIDDQWRTRGRGHLDQLQTALGGTNFLVDSVRLPGGGRFDIYRDDVKATRASLPSVCPHAEPKPPEELRPPGELLADIEFRFRDLGLVGRDASIHWVGRQDSQETWCRCELAAPGLARPRPAGWAALRDLRVAVVAMTDLVWSYAEGPRRGTALRESSRQTFDHLAERVLALARSLELPLPLIVADGRTQFLGPTSLPVVKRAGDVYVSEGDAALWLSAWRGVRVGIESQLEQHDRLLQPDGGSDDIDTRDYPLDAPAGTPPALKEAFEAVARALFDSAVFRRELPSGGLAFRKKAEGLAKRLRTAEERYAGAELFLQAAADDAGCAHSAALAVVRRVNDAVGRVVLGSVPDHMAVSHVRLTPAPDLRVLLRRMREQVSWAVTTATGKALLDTPVAAARVRCDGSDHSVYLDGNRLAKELHPNLFHFFRVIAEQYPNAITFGEIQGRAPGLRGKHQTRLKDRLPVELTQLLVGGKDGYALKLPPQK